MNIDDLIEDIKKLVGNLEGCSKERLLDISERLDKIIDSYLKELKELKG